MGLKFILTPFDISHLRLNQTTEIFLKDILLLAHLESAYSLIWGAREIWGKGGGETLALL